MTDVTVVPADGFFTEDLVSSLPYYEVTTVATFPLAGLLLDDERVIGLKVCHSCRLDFISDPRYRFIYRRPGLARPMSLHWTYS